MKTIFITGGHYTPAKAVLENICSQHKKWRIYYVGRKFAMEGDYALSFEYQELKDDLRINFLEITAGRLQRKFTPHTISSLLKIPIGFLQAFYWILKYKPSAILSFGGYVAIPVVSVAYLFNIPIVHHEQVLVFDYPSKFLSRICTKTLVSFPHLVEQNKNNKTLYTGNPLRANIFANNPNAEITRLSNLKKKLRLPIVYVTGGSQGSHAINQIILEKLETITSECLLIWQTGDSDQFRDYQEISNKINTLDKNIGDRVFVSKFISSSLIGSVYNCADLVIGRSGANTIFELAALGKPAILIPLPWTHNHEQLENAKFLEKKGSVVILPEKNLNKEFMVTFKKTLRMINVLQHNALKYKEVVPLDSAAKIVSVLKSLI